MTVGSKREFKAAIFLVGVIQMYAQEIHAFQKIEGRFAVPYSGFLGPGVKACHVGFVRHCDDAVLVPRHTPIAFRCFVECYEANEFALSDC